MPREEDEAGEAQGENDAQDAGERRERRSVTTDNVFAMAEDVLEKLKLLNYEKELMERKNIIPISRVYFAVQDANAGAQFSYFLAVITWLFGKAGESFTVDKYDDPSSSINKVMLHLRSIGFNVEFPPTKLKPGYGAAVCKTLIFLADKALERDRFALRKPEYPETDVAEEAEVDENADLGADDIEEDLESDDEDALYVEAPMEEKDEAAMGGSVREILENDNDPVFQAAWKTELERVGPKLKAANKARGQEWRAHLAQTRKHKGTIENALPGASKHLATMGSHIISITERTSSKERTINSQFAHLSKEYVVVQERLKKVNEVYNGSSEEVNRLTSELTALNESLEEIKGTMDTRGQSMTDTSPLQNIRRALSNMKKEIRTMELRIGVVGHALLQAKLNGMKRRARGEAPTGGIDDDDEDEDEDDDDSGVTGDSSDDDDGFHIENDY